jgi:sec-independent protein translocase protein TatB
MFDVGFWELTLLATIALLVIGPERLPGMVSTVGRMMGRARSLARGLKMQIEREMNQVNATDFSSKSQPEEPETQAEKPQSGANEETKPSE